MLSNTNYETQAFLDPKVIIIKGRAVNNGIYRNTVVMLETCNTHVQYCNWLSYGDIDTSALM